MVNRIPIVIARINTDISLTEFFGQVNNFAFDLEKAYWALALSYRQLETAKKARDSSQVTWKIVYEKWNEGVEPVQAEAQARGEYFRFRAAVEGALTGLFTAEATLRSYMGLAPTDGRLIRPIDEPTMARVSFDWGTISAETLSRDTTLQKQKWLLKQRELELISAKNQLLPRFDVGLVYRWLGRGDELIRTDNPGKNFAGNLPAEYVGSSAFGGLADGNFSGSSLLF